AAREHVERRGLAYVGTADEGNEWQHDGLSGNGRPGIAPGRGRNGLLQAVSRELALAADGEEQAGGGRHLRGAADRRLVNALAGDDAAIVRADPVQVTLEVAEHHVAAVHGRTAEPA